MYGPVCTVVWQGSAGDRRPYADQRLISEAVLKALRRASREAARCGSLAENNRLPRLNRIAAVGTDDNPSGAHIRR